MKRIEVLSPTPCTGYCSSPEWEDCVVCGWPEEPHSYDQLEINGMWFVIIPTERITNED